jgi:hypothetical protein
MAGFLFPRQHSQPTEISGFRVQSSVYGLPIPVVYGTARIAGNLIDFIQGDVIARRVASRRSGRRRPRRAGTTRVARARALRRADRRHRRRLGRERPEGRLRHHCCSLQLLWDLKLGTSSQTALAYLSRRHVSVHGLRRRRVLGCRTTSCRTIPGKSKGLKSSAAASTTRSAPTSYRPADRTPFTARTSRRRRSRR